MEATRGIGFGNIAADGGAEGMDAIGLVERGIREALSTGEGAVREMCEHIAGSGGKRLRPRLVLAFGQAFGGVNARTLHAAVASELIHMASLVHDDIIDRADIRRGRPAVNGLWGEHAAVLCGDWLFAQAFGLLAANRMDACMAYMVEAIQSMCRGEILQAGNRGNPDIGMETYLRIVTDKTAKLLESSCKCGAAASRAGSRGVRAAGEFGLACGIAFQIMDDVLDFRGDPGVTGKPRGEDLRQGIVTLPVILLLRHEKYGQRARELLVGGCGNGETVGEIGNLMEACGILDEACRVAGGYLDAAGRRLEGLPECGGTETLRSLAASLRSRRS